MTYSAGNPIQDSEYNAFATAATGMNQIFANPYPGAPTLPNAGFGYGQIPLTSVSAGNSVRATEWAALFTTMRKCGTHQGVVVSPPVPLAGPVFGDTIVAEDAGSTIASKIVALQASKFNLAPGQTSVIPGTQYSNPSSWTSSLVYTFQVNFGSWDNARHYFNLGGSISITGIYDPAPTADEIAWQQMFATDFPVNMNWQTTTQTAGSNSVVNPAGFYLNAPYPGLTTTYQSIYLNYVNLVPYSSSNYVRIEARLTAAAGTNGIIEFRISLVDIDAFPVSKAAGRMKYTINRIQSAGAISYLGTYAFVNGGFS